MADTVSDKDVANARKRVDKLNEQIAAARAEASATIRANENEVRLARLSAEEERLQAELEAIREQNKKSVVNATTRAVVEDVSEGQLAVAPAPASTSTDEEK